MTEPVIVDAAAPAATADLNVTVVELGPGQSLPAYVNDALDVLLVVTGGSGSLHCDGAVHPLGPSSAVVVPKGASRSVAAGGDGLRYVSAHRRRAGLTVGG